MLSRKRRVSLDGDENPFARHNSELNMVSCQFWPEGFLQNLGDTMPMALVRQQLKTSERNTLAFFLNPAGDFDQRLGLLRQRCAFVGGKQLVVIGLRVQVLALLRGDAQFRQMLIPNPDAFAGVTQRAFGKTILPAQWIAPDIAISVTPS